MPPIIDGTPVAQQVDQIVEALPVLAARLQPHGVTRPCAEHFALFSASGLRGGGMLSFASLLLADSGDFGGFETEAEDAKDGSDDFDEERQIRGPGRPKIEERLDWEQLLKHITNFLQSKGQVGADHHRLQATGEVYGAPLDKLAASCKAAGFDVSRSGLYNLMAPPRHNSRGPCRGLIDARPAGPVKEISLWHPRSRWSYHRVETAEEFLTNLEKQLPGVGERSFKVIASNMSSHNVQHVKSESSDL